MEKPIDHMLVIPLPCRRTNDGILVESQGASGMQAWCDHFENLTVVCPELPEREVGRRSSWVWTPLREVQKCCDVEIVPLPYAFTLRRFLPALPSAKRTLADLIDRSRFLQFALSGLIGDWGSIAAKMAIRRHRRFAVHLESVVHELMRREVNSRSLPHRLRCNLVATLMERRHASIIGHADLALCHGEDCVVSYGAWSRNAHLIHDVHVSAADLVSEEQLEAKLAAGRNRESVKIVYVGRMIWLKGPEHWLEAIAKAVEAGVDVEATWLGDGDLLEAMREQVRERGLSGRVHMPGFTADRSAVLAAMREADLLLFAHLTPESPRCLIESLVAGTPIVGYTSHYATDLIAGHGGGRLTPLGDSEALSRSLIELVSNRAELERMTRAAAADGLQFTREAVFAHRSHLINSN